jgi:hypothetical protein
MIDEGSRRTLRSVAADYLATPTPPEGFRPAGLKMTAAAHT